MIEILDTRINRYVALTHEEVHSLNVCRELMLQAVTFEAEGKNTDSFFTLARIERGLHTEWTPPWNLCENAIAEAQAKIYMMRE